MSLGLSRGASLCRLREKMAKGKGKMVRVMSTVTIMYIAIMVSEKQKIHFRVCRRNVLLKRRYCYGKVNFFLRWTQEFFNIWYIGTCLVIEFLDLWGKLYIAGPLWIWWWNRSKHSQIFQTIFCERDQSQRSGESIFPSWTRPVTGSLIFTFLFPCSHFF